METAIESKLANALFADARLSSEAAKSVTKWTRKAGDIAGFDVTGGETGIRAAEAVLEKFSAKWGGLWVGGRATLFADRLVFEPNAMNRFFHEDGHALTLDLPLDGIDKLIVRTAFVSDIIDMHVGERVFRVRCYKAKAFAARIWATRSARCSA